jgi:hypothetical protein
MDEVIRGRKREKKGKGLFFVQLGKKTNAKERRTEPCQARIPEKKQKKQHPTQE